ncbi:MAG: sulfurtransferase complex subunit TusB [Gammaproteobacteria bacterium]|nr:sulfurtransferase complex subunit TusB [Gammaproteobacteria bacterium]
MTTLHLVARSPARSDALEACLRSMAEGDALLLLEDGVYGALPVHPGPADSPCHALEEDVGARGLAGRLRADVTLVDYAGFVELVAAHERTLSWP